MKKAKPAAPPVEDESKWIRPKTWNPYVLHEGELVSPDGGRTFWEVLRVRETGADVKQLVGPSVGKVETWSSSSLVDRYTREQVEARKADSFKTRVTDKDENRCPNCWAPEPGVIDGVDRGRDTHCKDHKVDLEAAKARVPPPPRKKVPETPEVVARVLALREQGLSYKKIDHEMGWPPKAADRSYRIVKEHGKEVKG